MADKYKSMYKYELAAAAGVSSRTLYNWLKKHKNTLQKMGVTPKTKLLSPAAVRYICETFVIEPG